MTKLCEIHSQHPAIGCTIYALHVTLYGTVPAVSIPSAANTWHNQICSSRQVSPRTNLMVQNTCCRMYGHRSMVRRNGGWWDVNASHVLEWKWAQNFLHNIAAPDRLLRSSTCFLAQLLFRKKISYPIKKKKGLMNYNSKTTTKERKTRSLKTSSPFIVFLPNLWVKVYHV